MAGDYYDSARGYITTTGTDTWSSGSEHYHDCGKRFTDALCNNCCGKDQEDKRMEYPIVDIKQPGYLKKAESGRWTLNGRTVEDWLDDSCKFQEAVVRFELRIVALTKSEESLSPGA